MEGQEWQSSADVKACYWVLLGRWSRNYLKASKKRFQKNTERRRTSIEGVDLKKTSAS